MFPLDHITADGQTVTIYTKKPIATLPGMLGDPLFIIVDTSAEGKQDFDKQGPISTGPYVVKSFSKAKTELDANPNYYAAVPYKHVVVNTIDDPSTRAMVSRRAKSTLPSTLRLAILHSSRIRANSPPLKSIPSATFLPVFP